MRDILAMFEDPKFRGNDRWMVKCPGHEDNMPSLEIFIKPDRVLLHCFAGCKVDDILRKIGLKWSDLFARKEGEMKGNAAKTRLEAVYDYRGLDGKLLYQSLKYRNEDGSKRFVMRQPDGGGGWVNNLNGIDRVLFRLPELQLMLQQTTSRIVCVVEGEKDVINLGNIGVAATTIACGANAEWKESYSEYLRDCHVAVIPDNDPAGYAFAYRVIGSLIGHGVPSLRMIELEGPEGHDVSDWLESSTNRSDFNDLLLRTRPWRRVRLT
jgi:hypothetical protein